MIDAHDLVFKYYDMLYPHEKFSQQAAAIREEVLRRFGGIASSGRIKILDLCTGTGRLLSLFINHDIFELVGLDNNAKMLAMAKQKYPHATFIHGDVCTLGAEHFEGKPFHCILMGGASIQLFDSTQRKNIFETIRSILCEDGVFIFDFFNPEDSDPIQIRLSHAMNGMQAIILYHRLNSPTRISFRQYVHLIEQHGFDNASVATGEVDLYKLSMQSLKEEMSIFSQNLEPLPTQKENSNFLIAGKLG